MRKLLLIILIGLVAFVAINRQRLFLRDPLGKLYVNGTRIDSARVFINYSNDILVTTSNTDAAPAMFVVQGFDRIPGRPQTISCMSTMACLTDNDQANKIALGGRNYTPNTVMSNREVTFLDDAGDTQRVVIR